MKNEKKWKDSEMKMFERIKSTKHFTNLTRAQQAYSRYDAYSDDCIMELKYRSAPYDHYDEVLIERIKARELVRCIGGQLPVYYASKVNTGIYIWDIKGLALEGYDFKWHKKEYNRTSRFNNKNKVVKEAGYLHRDDAKYFIPTDETISGDKNYDQKKTVRIQEFTPDIDGYDLTNK